MALRLKNKAEQQKLQLLLIVLFLVANFYGLDWLNTQRQQLDHGLVQLHADEKYAEIVLADQKLWEKREAWLKKNQPQFDGSGQGSDKLMEQLVNLANQSNATILSKNLVEPTLQSYYQQVSVHLILNGSIEALCRLFAAIQQPDQFHAISNLSMRSDSDPTKVHCDVVVSTLNRQTSSSLPLTGAEMILAGEADVPKDTTADHFQIIWTRSPFGPPSAPAGQDDASAKWALTGMIGTADDPMVFLQNKETQEHLTLTNKANDKGFQVLSFLPSANIYESSASIHTPDGDIVVKYDHDLANPANNVMPIQNPMDIFNPVNPLQPRTFGQPYPNGIVPNHPIRHFVIPSPPRAPSPTSP